MQTRGRDSRRPAEIRFRRRGHAGAPPPRVCAQKEDDRPRQTLVAGYSGSVRGLAAVCTAAERAGRRGRVIIVQAYPLPRWPGTRRDRYKQKLADNRRRAMELITELLASGELPTCEYIPQVMAGRPADAIVRTAAAQRVAGVVIGRRRRGLIRSILFSSVHRELQGRIAGIPLITADLPTHRPTRTNRTLR